MWNEGLFELSIAEDVSQEPYRSNTALGRSQEEQVQRPAQAESLNFVESSAFETGNDRLLPHHKNFFPYQFNLVQTTVFEAAYLTDENLVVGSPTGSGKTVLMELAILRTFRDVFDGRCDKVAVYIAPLKALCQEKFNDWKSRFKELGLKSYELTGDSELDFKVLSHSHIMSSCCMRSVTTPEKWDSLTRRWKSNINFMRRIGLILVDEVHLLNEDRGACLEGVISRCKMMKAELKDGKFPASNMRFMALSATIPNINDIAEWLEAKIFSFGDEYRSVPLEWHAIPFAGSTNNYFLFERSLDSKLLNVISRFSEGKPCIVFCSTRKGCVSAAKKLAEQAGGRFLTDSSQVHRLSSAIHNIDDKAIQSTMKQGIGVHHAALPYKDRHCLESLFKAGDLKVLCATTTLSQGVNLPARLVVIKGTSAYQSGCGYVEYPTSTILQMSGRAGRPCYDNVGVCVVMTSQNQIHKYNKGRIRGTTVESHILPKLIDHLNAEVSLGTVKSDSEISQWLNKTFLRIRLAKNPKHYHIPNGVDPTKFLIDVGQDHLKTLASNGMLEYSPARDRFKGSPTSELTAKNYLQVETAIHLTKHLIDSTDLESLLIVLSEAKEFENFPIRMGEKKLLNAMNRGGKREKPTKAATHYPPIKYPVKEKRIKTTAEKIRIVIQTCLEGANPDNFSLMQDQYGIFQVAWRVANWIVGFAAQQSKFGLLVSATQLQKVMDHKIWPDSRMLPRQLPSIALGRAHSLYSAGIYSLQQFENTNISQLCKITKAKSLSGAFDVLRSIPKWKVTLSQTSDPSRVDISVLQDRAPLSDTKQWVSIIVGDESDRLLLHRRMQVKSPSFSFQQTLACPSSQTITVKVLNGKYFGFDVTKKLTLSQVPLHRTASSAQTPISVNQPTPKATQPTTTARTATPPPSKLSKKKQSQQQLGCSHEFPKCMQGLCKHPCCASKPQPRRPKKVSATEDHFAKFRYQPPAKSGSSQDFKLSASNGRAHSSVGDALGFLQGRWRSHEEVPQYTPQQLPATSLSIPSSFICGTPRLQSSGGRRVPRRVVEQPTPSMKHTYAPGLPRKRRYNEFQSFEEPQVMSRLPPYSAVKQCSLPSSTQDHVTSAPFTPSLDALRSSLRAQPKYGIEPHQPTSRSPSIFTSQPRSMTYNQHQQPWSPPSPLPFMRSTRAKTHVDDFVPPTPPASPTHDEPSASAGHLPVFLRPKSPTPPSTAPLSKRKNTQQLVQSPFDFNSVFSDLF